MPAGFRLLVTVPPSDHLRAELARLLPAVPAGFVTDPAAGPWPTVEAMLVGNPRREVPGWDPTLVPSLRFVQRIFTGLDEFPFDAFPPTVEIAGNAGGYGPFVAEHAIALLLAVTHNLPQNLALVRAGKLRPPLANRYLRGATVLVLGFGSIGHEIARRLRALGARVEGLSRTGRADPDAEAMYAATELRTALARADAVIDCRPLTRATKGSIDAGALAVMRPDAAFVNVGRARTVDEGALYEHLRTHPGFRAATDVWWDEDFAGGALRSRFPFPELPNFLGTPHVAGIGAAARDHAESAALENLVRFFRGERPRFIADPREYG